MRRTGQTQAMDVVLARKALLMVRRAQLKDMITADHSAWLSELAALGLTLRTAPL